MRYYKDISGSAVYEYSNYLEKNRQFFPEDLLYNRGYPRDYTVSICECGKEHISYGGHRFLLVCIDCAIEQMTTEIVWEWVYLKRGCECFSKERFHNTFPTKYDYMKYGHPNLYIFLKIMDSAIAKAMSFCNNNLQYKTEIDYEIGNHHRWGIAYEKISHVKDIKGKMGCNKGNDYTEMLFNLSKELDILPRDIPKKLVYTKLNLLNLNRLNRQRKKLQ